jgi:flavin reductase (DIM6/NTAB) family NADH-FMN oxidoreductase RutF
VDADRRLDYRRALGAFATGVAVVTAEDAQGALGLTINSFTSVSLDPPLILWCLDEVCDRRHAFHDAKVFGINVLAAEDEAHSRRFAKGAGRMDPQELEHGRGGAPLLKGALARLECVTRQKMSLGDHTVIVGEVADFQVRDGDGLLFFRGRYGRAHLPEA